MQSKTFSQSSSQSEKAIGIRGAKVGAALGARYGPYGMLLGGLVGFTIEFIADQVIEERFKK